MNSGIRPKTRAALAGLLIVMTSTACSRAFQQPQVRLDGIRLGGIGLRGGTVYAQVNVVNPNSFDLRAQSLTYDLELRESQAGNAGWQRLTQGTLNQELHVESNDSTTIEIPIEFSYDSMGGVIRSVIDRGTFEYRVSGNVQVTGPIRRTVPYRRTGTVDMAGVR